MQDQNGRTMSAALRDHPGRQHRQESAAQLAEQTTEPQQGFAKVSQQHLAAIVGQLLAGEGINDVAVWQPIITRLATEAAAAVLPSALAAFGVADPRFFIKVASSLVSKTTAL